MHRQVDLLQARAGREVQHGLGENPVLEARRENDGVPHAIELGVGKAADVVDALSDRTSGRGGRGAGNGGNTVHQYAFPAPRGRLIKLDFFGFADPRHCGESEP